MYLFRLCQFYTFNQKGQVEFIFISYTEYLFFYSKINYKPIFCFSILKFHTMLFYFNNYLAIFFDYTFILFGKQSFGNVSEKK
jgi:hypothetical protein